MTTLKQQLQEADKSVTFTRHIKNHFYDPENKKPVTAAFKKWLEQKRRTNVDSTAIIENILIDELLEDLKNE